MKLFRSLTAAVLASVMLLASLPPAFAQGPTVNQSVYSYSGQRPSYRAAKLALSPASSATDFFTIVGSATHLVRVLSLSCDGISTANATAIVQVVKRSTADLTGTSTTITAVPLNSVYPAATAAVKAYTVNPGTLGTLVGAIGVGQLTTNTVASSTVNNSKLVFDFSNQNVILNGVAQTLALNANAASFTSGAALDCEAVWAEN